MPKSKSKKKDIKVRDLKPSKDAKGGGIHVFGKTSTTGGSTAEGGSGGGAGKVR